MFSAPLLVAFLVAAPAENSKHSFSIAVVDEQTGRGVPLIELRTVSNQRYYTDSNGLVALHEPELMDRDVYFHVHGHGYEYPKDGFGYRGKTLRPTAGGRAKLAVRRQNIAERIYRLTGAGIYADSVLTGTPAPIKEPLLNGQVTGCDTVLNSLYRGKVYWFWGDTNRLSYPLGNFDTPGAISELPAQGGLDPDRGVDFTYFVDAKGFAKATLKMPGQGPTWMTALVPLKQNDGSERLYASFVKVHAPLTIYGRGLAVWNDERAHFDRVADVEMKSPIFPQGHSFRHEDFVYFGNPFPLTRVRATAEAFQDITAYESFTCLKEGSRLDAPAIDHDAAGRARYAWKRNTPAVGPAEQATLINSGKLKTDETLLHFRDHETGKSVMAHAGSVYWNDYRRRWVLITVQSGGTSYLGEVWYAEAETPTGPWGYAVKIVTHEKYDFYNPKHDPLFDKDGGKTIFFEGTYTNTFSGNPERTPRYDYNQVMYKLDLGDLRLSLPGPVKVGEEAAEFHALERAGVGSVPVVWRDARLSLGNPDEKEVVFHALPAEAKDPPATSLLLYEFHDTDGKRFAYSTEANKMIEGMTRSDKPLCRVWRKP